MSTHQSWQQEMVDRSMWQVPDLAPRLGDATECPTYRGLPVVSAASSRRPSPSDNEVLEGLYDGSDRVEITVEPPRGAEGRVRDRMNGMISMLECGLQAMLYTPPANRNAIKHTQRTLGQARQLLMVSSHADDQVTFQHLLDNYMRLSDMVERRLEQAATPQDFELSVSSIEMIELTPVDVYGATRPVTPPPLPIAVGDETEADDDFEIVLDTQALRMPPPLPVHAAGSAASGDPNHRGWAMTVLNRYAL